jgi:hypothetical protein
MSEASEEAAAANAESKRTIERHFQSIALTILTGVTAWFGLTVQDSTVKLATLTERLSGLERQISDNREQIYTARDAQKDLELRDSVLANIASRVLALENAKRK